MEDELARADGESVAVSRLGPLALRGERAGELPGGARASRRVAVDRHDLEGFAPVGDSVPTLTELVLDVCELGKRVGVV